MLFHNVPNIVCLPSFIMRARSMTIMDTTVRTENLSRTRTTVESVNNNKDILMYRRTYMYIYSCTGFKTHDDFVLNVLI